MAGPYDDTEGLAAVAYVPDEETRKTIADIKTFFERAQEDRRRQDAVQRESGLHLGSRRTSARGRRWNCRLLS